MPLKKIGIIGTGRMAATMVRAMQSSGIFEPVAVFSGTTERAASFARRFSLQGHGENPDSFLQSGAFEAIYIATRNVDHVAMARAALLAGIPVLLEKPLTLESADTIALCALAQDLDVALMENLWVLALPAYQALKARAGEEIRTLSFDFSIPVTAQQMPGLFEKNGGGVIYDRAVYGFAYASDLLGPIVDMRSHVQRNHCGLDLRAALQLIHQNGAVSMITVAFDQAGSNDLVVSAEQEVFCLNPALGGEALSAKSYSYDYSLSDAWASENRVAKLKQFPILRRFKQGLQRRGTDFYSYGKNMYHPVLKEFSETIDAGKIESALVPHDLSREVSRLIDMAGKA